MKQLYFNPFFKQENIDAAESEFFSDPFYIAKIDNSRPVKATVTTTGSYFGTSLAVKFIDCATEGGSYDDVTDGDFAAQTATGSASITFTLGTNVHIGTQDANYGKWLKLSITGTGGDTGGTTDVDLTVKLENIFVPDDVVELRRHTIAAV